MTATQIATQITELNAQIAALKAQQVAESLLTRQAERENKQKLALARRTAIEQCQALLKAQGISRAEFEAVLA